MLGNDIVDLGAAPRPTAEFLDRVFGEADRTDLVWDGFAAKEAFFKALKKIRPQLPIPFREIRVLGDEARFGGFTARLRWQRTDRYVHCLAALADLPRVQVHVELCDPDAASARVRELALLRLAEAGLGDCEIRKDPGAQRFRPPRVYQSGELRPRTEISFSHDGNFVALALSM